MSLSAYYRLAKPGIVYGNLLAGLAGYLFASPEGGGWVNLARLAATLLGLGLVVASACVFNNVFDADIDRKMSRTKVRPLAAGTIGRRQALGLGLLLGAAGLALLIILANWLAAALALTGWLVYVLAYTPLKRLTRHATLVGSVAGAMPPIVGYTAAAGRLDVGALLLFIIMAIWQMPHFYAIAVFRLKEYQAAGLPVLPAVLGVNAAKRHILFWISAFGLTATLPFFFGLAGVFYLAGVLALSAWWLRLALGGLNSLSAVRWARRLFKVSLMVLLGTSLALALGPRLP
ncbi:MAG: protoheme IX farnesyltransferase [Candidatus Chaera renei]|uniref:Protoheme IX farnesyltransferase n=1 Tax=Candidatus Chaera renei TaxID=2506947 RepID=A0A4Q0AIL3_9BACT|nr:MAG: protoheme IX farnesyltransferase [Candidatus Chaera renei]